MSRNRKQKQQRQLQAIPTSSSPPTSRKVVSGSSVLQKVTPHSINFGMLAVAIIALIPAYAGLMFQWHQISDLQQSKTESDRQVNVFTQQMESLRSAIGKSRDLEVNPRLTIECPDERIELTSGPQNLMKDAKLRVKNVGRGTAYSVYADVMFDDVKIDSGEIDQNWREKIKNHRPISQKTLPPGESLLFTDFDFPLVHTTNPQGLKGKIGFICKDEDGKDVFDLQDFIIIVHLEADRPHAHFDFKTPFRTTGQVHRTPKELEAFLESQRVSEKGK